MHTELDDESAHGSVTRKPTSPRQSSVTSPKQSSTSPRQSSRPMSSPRQGSSPRQSTSSGQGPSPRRGAGVRLSSQDEDGHQLVGEDRDYGNLNRCAIDLTSVNGWNPGKNSYLNGHYPSLKKQQNRPQFFQKSSRSRKLTGVNCREEGLAHYGEEEASLKHHQAVEQYQVRSPRFQ